MDKTRKLRRELGYHISKLHGLQESADLTLDEPDAKALALQIRQQAGTCLDVLDRYQSSVPGRMWSDAEQRCQPLREELRRTEMLYRVNAGEWEGRVLPRSFVQRTCQWTGDDVADPGDDLGGTITTVRERQPEDERFSAVSSRDDVDPEAHGSLEALMALIDDVALDGEKTTGPLRFSLPMNGDSREQNMLVLVPSDSGIVYEHQYGGAARRHAEVEGFLVPAWAEPEASESLHQLFVTELGGDGIRDEGWPEAVAAVRDAIKRIWYRGTGERLTPLRFDVARAAELDEAWAPVLTPDGPGYLAWVNSDQD